MTPSKAGYRVLHCEEEDHTGSSGRQFCAWFFVFTT